MKTITRKIKQKRTIQADLKAKRSEDNKEGLFIEGYFAVFNKMTELWKDAYEVISPQAFNDTLSNDIRALINHDTTLVLGRNKANTLELKVDSYGLWGRIHINENDTDAVNLYERVKRKDVNNCSFGFEILEETTDWSDEGNVKWTIIKADLHEVSICTFPAYADTEVQARKAEVEVYKKREKEIKKNKVRERLKNYGIKAIND